jgi:squalene-hopene/tetraprenyl-beta-curcumene cyclase
VSGFDVSKLNRAVPMAAKVILALGVLAVCALAVLGRVGTVQEAGAAGVWNPKKAAAYLDQREQWWMAWPVAARDHGTFCVSCHTSLPYALARPALRAALGEQAPSPGEQKLLESVIKRVRLWNEVAPLYTDEHSGKNKSNESRGTESVLNALVLVSHDAPAGQLSDDTRAALDNMWALQLTEGDRKGAWPWLQFGNEPFEAHDSDFYGAALAAVTTGAAGDAYRAAPELHDHLASLREYLDREYAKQSPMNQVVLLWASAKWPELLSPEQRKAIISGILSAQRSDGGWNLASLAWSWRDWTVPSLVKNFTRSYGTTLKGISDGYATAIITYALEQSGLGHDDPHLAQARAWLLRNQTAQGFWPSFSLNNQRDPYSATGRFMSDAATAYAVLALTAAN